MTRLRTPLESRTASTVWAGLTALLVASACMLPGCARDAQRQRGDRVAPVGAERSDGLAAGRTAGVEHAAPSVRASTEVGPRPWPAGRIRGLRKAVEACGGLLRCDGRGQPIEVDFVSPRAMADRAAFRAIVECPTLRSVRLIAGQLSETELRQLGQLKNLEQLALQDATATDTTLKAVADGCRRLRRVALRNLPRVTDASVSALAELPELTHLSLIEVPITGAAVRTIARVPQLISLDLRSCPQVASADLAELAEAPRLKELKLGGPGVDNPTLVVLARLPHLESLTVEDAELDGTGLKQLASSDAASRIRLLSFARCASLDDEALAMLRAFTRLRHLSLRDLPVTGRFLVGQPWLDQLEVLVLNQTFLTDEGLRAIAACRNVKRLELAQNVLSPDAMEAIGSLSRLEVLNLSECGLTDEMLRPLAGLSR
ncbi:MAG TPA: hypothetical protein EYP14_09075, partial [Planctomycetaceae bacterium]|nr:hypothetical protein [Planctomycetaceae bacterium]